MRLREVTLREIRMRLVTPFETSVDRMTERRIILLEADVDGVIGWGECTAGEHPFFSPEDTDTAWHILENYLWPMMKGKEFASAAQVWGLLEEVRGHTMAKALLPVQRLRQEFPRIKLMVDANSAYRKTDWPLLKELDGFYLMMIEQPLGWDDLYGHVEVQKGLQTPICLDECIRTYEQAEAAIALGACKIINIKLGRVGGFHEARQIQDLCARK